MGLCAGSARSAARRRGGVPVRVVHRWLPVGEREGVHTHPFVELYEVQSGRGTLMVGGRPGVAAAQTVTVVAPGAEHGLAADAGWACGARLVQFDAHLVDGCPEAAEALSGILRLAGSGHGTLTLRGPVGQRTQSLITTLGHAAAEGGGGAPRVCGEALEELCVRLWRQFRDARVGHPSPGAGVAASAQPTDGGRPQIEQVLAYIDHNLARPISREDLARQASFAPSYFSSLFREATGTTIPEYINARRIRRAQELLREPHTRVSSVCYAVGFRDLSNFNRVFKRIVGQTPREYRMALFGEEEEAVALGVRV